MLGVPATERTLRDVVFAVAGGAAGDDSLSHDSASSSLSHSSMGYSDDEAVEVLHGRAMACFCILQGHFRILDEMQTMAVKEWMRHDSPMVRKAACQIVGYILRSVQDLKDFKSALLKCMRATEDAEVHLVLGQALSRAARHHDKLFLCKAGLPLLDGALMLSSSRATPPHVQQAFHLFLYNALQKQEGGLQEYMNMSEGENGRMMMTLVTKTLAKLPVVEEGDEEEGHRDVI